MSTLANLKGWFLSKCCAMVKMSLWTACPRLAIDFCGALQFVPSLTDGIFVPWKLSLKDRSRMALNFLDLCGIIAIGEILRFFGGACLMQANLILLAKFPFSFSTVSWSRQFLAAADFADMCAPLLTAAVICSLVQGSPQSTGHPFLLQSCNIVAASCSLARPLGHIKPDLPMSSATGIVSGKILESCSSLSNAALVRKPLVLLLVVFVVGFV